MKKDINNYSRDIKILIAEDEKDIRDYMKRSLSIIYENVDVACDGTEACSMLKLSEYDLIITDINMPKMCGNDLIKHVQDLEYKIPILIVSANAIEMEDFYKDYPCIKIAGKPPRVNVIIEYIEELIGNIAIDCEFENNYNDIAKSANLAKELLAKYDSRSCLRC